MAFSCSFAPRTGQQAAAGSAGERLGVQAVPHYHISQGRPNGPRFKIAHMGPMWFIGDGSCAEFNGDAHKP
jgi:hypothetical protein